MPTIADGFGTRLREERERLGMTQAQLSEVAGVRRMAQGLYESGTRAPTVKYLAAIAGAGVDLQYALFGQRATVPAENQRGLEKKIFELVEQFVQRQPDGQLGAEGRYAMFDFLRSEMSGSNYPNVANKVAATSVY